MHGEAQRKVGARGGGPGGAGYNRKAAELLTCVIHVLLEHGRGLFGEAGVLGAVVGMVTRACGAGRASAAARTMELWPLAAGAISRFFIFPNQCVHVCFARSGAGL